MEKSIEISHDPRFLSLHDLVNKLAVIVGHCDLLSDHLKAGSPCAQRVGAIQDIAQGIATELQEHQRRLAESDRSVTMQNRDVAEARFLMGTLTPSGRL